MAVRDHGPVSPEGHRHRHRAVPLGELPTSAEVDPLLLLQRAPAEVAVVVVTERSGQRGAKAEPSSGDGEVGDPARARRQPLGPHLRARLRGAGQPGEDEVEEDGSPDEDVDLWRVGRPTALSGSNECGGGTWPVVPTGPLGTVAGVVPS